MELIKKSTYPRVEHQSFCFSGVSFCIRSYFVVVNVSLKRGFLEIKILMLVLICFFNWCCGRFCSLIGVVTGFALF